MKDAIACCYFPTTTIFIDDQVGFLTSLELKLPEFLAVKTYSSPIEALKFLKQEKNYYADFVKRWLTRLSEIDANFNERHAHPVIEIDLLSIHQLIYSKERFSRPAVVVVDYAMPESDGIVCCRELKGSPLKKIMFTGEATEELGVKAFNQELIDHFILKKHPNFLEELVQAIDKLQHQYFKHLSQHLVRGLSTHHSHTLTDPVFIQFFKKLCIDRNIVEFYLVDDEGSFLMLDQEGNVSWLFIKKDETVQLYADLAEANAAPSSVRQALESRQKLPFFLTEHDTKIVNGEWETYLHPATLLKGKTDYYYAIVDGVSVYDIQPEKIVSYQDYLNSIGQEGAQ